MIVYLNEKSCIFQEMREFASLQVEGIHVKKKKKFTYQLHAVIMQLQ